MLEVLARLNVAPEEVLAPAGNGEKRPLHRALPPAPAFPLDALGSLRPAAEALHLAVRCPLSMCTQSALAAATLVIAPHFDVALPSGRRPLTGLFVTIAESGERKTSLDKLALRAVYDAEKRWAEDTKAQRSAYTADKAAYEAAVAVAKKRAKGDRAATRSAIETLGSEPAAPRDPMLLVGDPTAEGLTLHLEARPWCGVFSSESGAFIGGHALRKENKMATAALLNTLWDGGAIRRRRVLTGSTFLPGCRCSAHLMMQGVVAEQLFADPMLDGIGLLARVLLVAPESAAGTRLWREPDPSVWRTLGDYERTLTAFLDREPAVTEAGALAPQPLDLDPDAKALWVAFHDEAERDMRQGGELAGMRAFASKLPEHAGRLAAVLAVYADPETTVVSAEAMAQGIELAKHYTREMQRLAAGAQVAPELQAAERLLHWWQSQPEPAQHLATIYQRGPASLRDAVSARAAVATLEEHGWLRRLPAGEIVDGQPRREAWGLVQ